MKKIDCDIDPLSFVDLTHTAITHIENRDPTDADIDYWLGSPFKLSRFIAGNVWLNKESGSLFIYNGGAFDSTKRWVKYNSNHIF